MNTDNNIGWFDCWSCTVDTHPELKDKPLDELELEHHVIPFKRTGEVSEEFTTYKGTNVRVGTYTKYNSKYKGKVPYHKIRHTKEYNEQGKPHGNWIEYHWGSKRKKRVEVYDNGKCKKSVAYNWDGFIIMEIHYNEQGKRKSEKFLYEDGTIKSETIYGENGSSWDNEEEIYKSYNSDGTLETERIREKGYTLEKRGGVKYYEHWYTDLVSEKIYHMNDRHSFPNRIRTEKKENGIFKTVELYNDRVELDFRSKEISGHIVYDLKGNAIEQKVYAEWPNIEYWYNEDGNVCCGYIYRVYHPVLKKYYIGKCYGQNPTGSYKGSGAILTKLFDGQYPREEWQKEILYEQVIFNTKTLEWCTNRRDLGKIEEEWISKLNAVESDEYLNLTYVGVYLEDEDDRYERDFILKTIHKNKGKE